MVPVGVLKGNQISDGIVTKASYSYLYHSFITIYHDDGTGHFRHRKIDFG